MAQSADADDSHLVGGFHVKLHDRVEHGDAATEQRTGRLKIDPFGNCNYAGGIRAHLIGKAAVMRNNGRLGFCAKILISGFAGMTVAAIAAVPTQPDDRSFLQVQDMAPPGGNPSDHLVAGHQRVL